MASMKFRFWKQAMPSSVEAIFWTKISTIYLTNKWTHFRIFVEKLDFIPYFYHEQNSRVILLQCQDLTQNLSKCHNNEDRTYLLL